MCVFVLELEYFSKNKRSTLTIMQTTWQEYCAANLFEDDSWRKLERLENLSSYDWLMLYYILGIFNQYNKIYWGFCLQIKEERVCKCLQYRDKEIILRECYKWYVKQDVQTWYLKWYDSYAKSVVLTRQNMTVIQICKHFLWEWFHLWYVKDDISVCETVQCKLLPTMIRYVLWT